MDFDELRIFSRVADLASFSRAAEQLGLANRPYPSDGTTGRKVPCSGSGYGAAAWNRSVGPYGNVG